MWFVVGYYIFHCASILLIYKIKKQRSAYGISLDSQIALLIAALSRCVWFSDTQLPTMNIAILELAIAVCLHSFIVY